ncbi:thiol-disulfide oxidoreductase DCC family protein [Salisediminibacterium selenitireducens]|uniref:Thiol-disulfide oxidoreductase DCC n=1 Tax=Bacillus selenitireducens (strain ATCC 700615 / DSM 15326 / MLS10) TaxID=439292 RepID=D6XUH3_BACIE|nr:DCC1-like thiol-disulfide oxidoreductase family protein [Salisediminibacterium selenitireducens]ADH99459.1 putative thiol-disulfide oxidoreductase DCC [[Bacillus] selenitireducens MLS10]
MRVLFYDGFCNLCDASVQFILKHERDEQLSFCSLESHLGLTLMAHHPELKEIDAIILVDTEAETIHTASNAVIEISKHLRLPWSLVSLGGIAPFSLRETLYRFVAKNRYRVFGQKEACRLPNKQMRHRFLDTAQ